MKVLVPVDGSKYSLEALRVAIDLVQAKGGEITVINVVPFIGGIDDHEISPGKRERHMESMEKRADEIVREAADMLVGASVAAKSTQKVVTSVSVPDAVIDYAEKERVDVIVLGSRGLSPSARFKLGSVASQVVKYAPCSVYVVKLGGE
jgi:nucleotide-binding universal stress UspA family protein